MEGQNFFVGLLICLHFSCNLFQLLRKIILASSPRKCNSFRLQRLARHSSSSSSSNQPYQVYFICPHIQQSQRFL
ncbi:unnamed protein product [Gongylonema pulchrum]|uniref:Secreted protein n=1 Tax=Gongylonema pulchrum TaxID=637853 RepID=A0A183DNK5_9BILA|nr:unnamed protein product [Gongylonema pulchrum]